MSETNSKRHQQSDLTDTQAMERHTRSDRKAFSESFKIYLTLYGRVLNMVMPFERRTYDYSPSLILDFRDQIGTRV